MYSTTEYVNFASGLALDVRCDGRSRMTFRPIIISEGPSSLADALDISIAPRIAHGAGHCEVLNPDCRLLAVTTWDIADAGTDDHKQGVLRFHVTNSAHNSAPSHITGSNRAQLQRNAERQLERQLAQLYSVSTEHGFDRAQLYIGKGRAFILTVNIYIISAETSSTLLTLATLAVKGALGNTQLPVVSLQTASHGDEVFVQVNKQQLQMPLRAHGAPLVVVLNINGSFYFVDAAPEEETFQDGCLFLGFVGHELVTTEFVLHRQRKKENATEQPPQAGFHFLDFKTLVVEATSVLRHIQSITTQTEPE